MKQVRYKTCGSCTAEHLESVVYYCNICCKKFTPQIFHDGKPHLLDDEILDLDYSFGFSSGRDGECHSLQLCKECYNTKILPLMRIDPVVGNYIHGPVLADDDGAEAILIPDGFYLVAGVWVELQGYVDRNTLTSFDIDTHPLADGETFINLLNGNVTVRKDIA